LPIFGIGRRLDADMNFGLRTSDFGPSRFGIPNRDAMSPPKLAADAPVLDVAHPMVVNLRPALRMEAHLAWERRRLGGVLSRGIRRRDAGAPSLFHTRP